MTIEPRAPSVRLTVAGTGPYAFGFPVFDEADVLAHVELADVVVRLDPGTDFAVALAVAGPRAGGAITLSTAIAAAYPGAELQIDRDVAREQGWQAVTAGRETGLEAQLDLTVMGLQDAWREIGRAMRFTTAVEALALPGADRPIVGDGAGGLKIGPDLGDLDGLRAAAARLDAWLAGGGDFGFPDGLRDLIEQLRLEVEVIEVHGSAVVRGEVEAIVTATEALASRIRIVEASFNGDGEVDFSAVSAMIVDEREARAAADAAAATARQALTAQVGATQAALDTIAQAQATADAARAQLETVLDAVAGDNAATVQVLASVTASVDAATAAVDALEAAAVARYVIRAKAGATEGSVEIVAPSGQPSRIILTGDEIDIRGRVPNLVVGEANIEAFAVDTRHLIQRSVSEWATVSRASSKSFGSGYSTYVSVNLTPTTPDSYDVYIWAVIEGQGVNVACELGGAYLPSAFTIGVNDAGGSADTATFVGFRPNVSGLQTLKLNARDTASGVSEIRSAVVLVQMVKR